MDTNFLDFKSSASYMYTSTWARPRIDIFRPILLHAPCYSYLLCSIFFLPLPRPLLNGQSIADRIRYFSCHHESLIQHPLLSEEMFCERIFSRMKCTFKPALFFSLDSTVRVAFILYIYEAKINTLLSYSIVSFRLSCRGKMGFSGFPMGQPRPCPSALVKENVFCSFNCGRPEGKRSITVSLSLTFCSIEAINVWKGQLEVSFQMPELIDFPRLSLLKLSSVKWRTSWTYLALAHVSCWH